MKLILIGHGYIGTEIARELIEQDIKFNWLDHEHQFTMQEIEATEMVINAAGYMGEKNIDDFEKVPFKAKQGTVEWVAFLSKAFPKRVLHIGTGCLYEGEKNGKGWSEKDAPTFDKSLYSKYKIEAEQIIDISKNWVLRIRQPFGKRKHPKNLLTKFQSYSKLNDVTGSITCIEDMAKVVAFFVKIRPAFGIYNCVNPGATSVRAIAQLMKLDKEWFTPEEFAVACPAPRSNCVLDATKLTDIYPLNFIDYALHTTVKAYK